MAASKVPGRRCGNSAPSAAPNLHPTDALVSSPHVGEVESETLDLMAKDMGLEC
jgi:hypothetical protein